MNCPPRCRKTRLAPYRRLREKYHETVGEQWLLAAWCQKAKLDDQWRAHLSNVLVLNPDHQQARAALGYQLVDGVWLTPQEIEGANARAAAAVAALNQWKPKLAAIRDGLQGKSPHRRELARQKLAAVQDAAAVPSLELVFCDDTEPVARVGVDKFAQMTVAEASLALARQALFSPWKAVRKAATEKLKTRDRESYVPELLSAMGSSVQSRIEMFQEPNGRLLYRHAFYRPGQGRDQLVVLDTMYLNTSDSTPDEKGALWLSSQVSGEDNGKRTLIFDDGTRATLLPDGGVRPDGPQSDVSRTTIAQVTSSADAVRALMPWGTLVSAPASAVAKARAREKAVLHENESIAALNAPICQLLANVTGLDVDPSRDAWSEWWVNTDEVYVPGNNPVAMTYIPNAQMPMREESFSVLVPSGTTMHYSCLAAGTPVWTDTGLLAVEEIKVGDRVLAQDAETGELAYKPVLHTTVRTDAQLVKLELPDDTVTCSVGHAFWISGKGWVKARDIQPGMNFHGAAGTTPLRRSAPAGVGSVYNLIVADFHSYFVGKDLIYSHDVTARRPSDVPVPGLARR